MLRKGKIEETQILKSSLNEIIYIEANGSSDFMDLFRSQIYSEFVCDECGFKETSFEDRIMMELDIPNDERETDIIKWFHRTFEKTHYGEDNEIECGGCKRVNSFTKQEWVSRFPKIMIIQLKRFGTDIVEENEK